jgi:Dockerin type I domain
MRSIIQSKRVLLHLSLTLCCLVVTSTLLLSQNISCGAKATPTVMAGYINRLANLSTAQPPQLPPNGMTYTIPIHVWVSKPSFDLESLYTTINQVNSTFLFSNGARFEICKVTRITDFVDVDLRNGTQHQNLYNTHNTPNMINLYLVDKISDSVFPLQSWGGFAKFPFDALEVVVVSNFLPITISHEFGHFFGLLHTFDESGGFDKEFVTRNISEGANCTTVPGVVTGKADRLCETAADPYGLPGNTCLNGNTCTFYDGNIRPNKPNGDVYTPPYDNIMSYYLATANQFVSKQQQIMSDNLANYPNRNKFLTMTPCMKTTSCYGNINRFCQESYPAPPLNPTYAVEKNLYLQNYIINITNQSNGATVGSPYFVPFSGSGDNYYSNDVPFGNISIKPSKYNDWLNGVTTFDISLINKHLLDIQPFSYPFTKIAADVNNDGQIDAADMLHLRNLILRKIDFFPNNVGSYRFVPNAYLQSPSFLDFGHYL